MDITPGLPVALTEADITRLTSWLDDELGEALDDHTERENRLDKWQKAYDGEPVTSKKSFPWEGACNIVIPLIGIAVDSIVARLVNTIFSVEPFWSTRALTKQTELVAKPVEGFMEWSRRREFNMYRETRKWAIEVVKFGWGYFKVPWDVATVRSFRIGKGGKPEAFDRITRRPNPQHILLMDIIPQVGIEDDLGQAEWFAHRIRLTDGELMWRQHDKMYQNIEKVMRKKEDTTELQERLARGTMQSTARYEKLNTLYEIWCNFVLGKQKLPIPIVVTYHPDTKTILRAIHNPHMTGIRPFVKGKFIEWEGRREGFGIARQLMALQEEISTIHCQQVDNATLANTRFFVGRRGVVRNGTRIWPGRFLAVPNPKEDIVAMQLGDIYQSMRALEISALSYSERRSGVSDYQLGRESNVLGSRATATGTLAVIQEGNRRFDLNVRDMRDSLGQVGQLVLQLNAQFRPKGIAYFVQGSDGQFTEQLLDLPEDFIADGMGIELTASTATINREIEKQGLIALMGLVTQYYERLLQVAALTGNPNVPAEVKELGVKMASGARTLMERIIQTFEVKNIDAILPEMMDGIEQTPTPYPTGRNPEDGQLAGVLESLAGTKNGGAAGPTGQ